LSRAASRRTSEIAGSRYWVDISEPQLHDARHLECGETIRTLPSGGASPLTIYGHLAKGGHRHDSKPRPGSERSLAVHVPSLVQKRKCFESDLTRLGIRSRENVA
jgi:hypothetical protein